MMHKTVNRRSRSPALAAVAALTLCVLATAPARAEATASATAPTPGATLSTADFIQVMSNLDAFEQRAGKLAQVLAQNNDIRRFGRDLAEDQRNTQILSQGLAQASLPAPGFTALPQNQLDLLSTLHRLSDREFDRMFIDMEVQTHTEALSIVQAYAQSGDNPAMKAAAAKLAQTLQQRLGQAKSMLRTVG